MFMHAIEYIRCGALTVGTHKYVNMFMEIFNNKNKTWLLIILIILVQNAEFPRRIFSRKAC